MNATGSLLVRMPSLKRTDLAPHLRPTQGGRHIPQHAANTGSPRYTRCLFFFSPFFSPTRDSSSWVLPTASTLFICYLIPERLTLMRFPFHASGPVCIFGQGPRYVIQCHGRLSREHARLGIESGIMGGSCRDSTRRVLTRPYWVGQRRETRHLTAFGTAMNSRSIDTPLYSLNMQAHLMGGKCDAINSTEDGLTTCCEIMLHISMFSSFAQECGISPPGAASHIKDGERWHMYVLSYHGATCRLMCTHPGSTPTPAAGMTRDYKHILTGGLAL